MNLKPMIRTTNSARFNEISSSSNADDALYLCILTPSNHAKSYWLEVLGQMATRKKLGLK